MKKLFFLFTLVFLLFLFIAPISNINAAVDPGGSGGDGDDGVTVPVEGDWVQEIFGEDGLQLNILKPINFFGIEGTASIWSILAMVFELTWPILFLAFLVMVAIGVIKWISSGGEQAKVESAQKTVKNAAYGFIATALLFVVVNIATWWLGIGDIFKLAQNLAVCNGIVLYEFKRDDLGGVDADVSCTCTDSGWSCSASTP